MNDADKAYAAAQIMIADARENGEEELSFDDPDTRALEALPPEIATLETVREVNLANTKVTDLSPLSDLTGLTRLWLSYTDVTDLSPLSGLTGLTTLGLTGTRVTDLSPLSGLTGLDDLWLSSTSVTNLTPLSGLTALTQLNLFNSDAMDLRPLRTLYKLAQAPDVFGLTFSRCAACGADPEIARISEIKDNKERAATLFAYLEDWQPPGEGAQGNPAPDELFPVDLKDQQLEVSASSPTAAELEEALKRSMHAALIDLVDRLAQVAGNQYPRLADAARRLAALIDGPFETLQMPAIHLAMNELRGFEKLGEEDYLRFDSTVSGILTSVNDAGGALTMDHPQVALLMDRARRAREAPEPDADKAAQDAMSAVVADDEKAIGPGLRETETQVLSRNDAQAVVGQKAVNRNVLWRIGMTVTAVGGFVGTTVVGAVVTDLLGVPVVEFVKANLPVLANAAHSYGPVFAESFLGSLAKTQEFAGLVADLPGYHNSKRGARTSREGN